MHGGRGCALRSLRAPSVCVFNESDSSMTEQIPADVPITPSCAECKGNSQPPTRYTVHCYATVRVSFGALEAASPQAAARLAESLFDWDQQQGQAEFADELTEYLVDIEGAADFSQSRRFDADFEEIRP